MAFPPAASLAELEVGATVLCEASGRTIRRAAHWPSDESARSRRSLLCPSLGPHMREVSPAENMSVDDFLRLAPAWVRAHAARIRAAKREGQRPRPSATLIDQSALLTGEVRAGLLDRVASLVDENLFGRSEMCIQFAELLHRALAYVNLPSRAVVGRASYYADGQEIFGWEHAWVHVGGEVIDGNVDSLAENPVVPPTVTVAPYWGPIARTPADRRLREEPARGLPRDHDVADVWWPELRAWLDEIVGVG